jgi:hypothetical protein
VNVVEERVDGRVAPERVFERRAELLRREDQPIDRRVSAGLLERQRCEGRTDHRARDPTAVGVAFLAEVDIVELEPEQVLLGRLEMLALGRVALDLGDGADRNLWVRGSKEGREGNSKRVPGVVREREVDVVAGQAEQLGEVDEAGAVRTSRSWGLRLTSFSAKPAAHLVPNPASCDPALDLRLGRRRPGDERAELVEQVAELLLLRAEPHRPVGEHLGSGAERGSREKRRVS